MFELLFVFVLNVNLLEKSSSTFESYLLLIVDNELKNLDDVNIFDIYLDVFIFIQTNFNIRSFSYQF